MILPEDYINRPVRSLQTMLRVLSTIFPALLNVNPDGIYGESTKNAVSAFQRFAHLPATGIAETETWNALAGCYLRHAPIRLAAGAASHRLAAGADNCAGRTEPACLSRAGNAAGARAMLRKRKPSRRHRCSGRFHAARRAELAGAVRSRADRRH